MSKAVTPRGAYPHTKRVGDFIFVSGTSSRRADNSIAGAEQVDNMGTKKLDVAIQTTEVLQNIDKNQPKQLNPTFGKGHLEKSRYHNIGQLKTPYEGKIPGTHGDYGPVQTTDYYTPQNPNYPYVLDRDFRAVQYQYENNFYHQYHKQ